MPLGLNFMVTFRVVLYLQNHTLNIRVEQLDLALGP